MTDSAINRQPKSRMIYVRNEKQYVGMRDNEGTDILGYPCDMDDTRVMVKRNSGVHIQGDVTHWGCKCKGEMFLFVKYQGHGKWVSMDDIRRENPGLPFVIDVDPNIVAQESGEPLTDEERAQLHLRDRVRAYAIRCVREGENMISGEDFNGRED